MHDQDRRTRNTKSRSISKDKEYQKTRNTQIQKIPDGNEYQME